MFYYVIIRMKEIFENSFLCHDSVIYRVYLYKKVVLLLVRLDNSLQLNESSAVL